VPAGDHAERRGREEGIDDRAPQRLQSWPRALALARNAERRLGQAPEAVVGKP
jgi:hypothetical protein